MTSEEVRKLMQKRRKRARALWRKGHSINEIADRLGVAISTIHRYCEDLPRNGDKKWDNTPTYLWEEWDRTRLKILKCIHEGGRV